MRSFDGDEDPTRPQTYLNLALLAFALLGLELVILAAEPVVGLPAGGVLATVVHWVLTTSIWVGGASAMVVWALRRTDFRLVGEAGWRMGVARWGAIAVLVVVTVGAQWTLRGGVLAPVAEHSALSERFGDAGTMAWLVQLVYYVAELAVVALIVGCGQQAGEGRFRSTRVPWGGLLLALTWGLVHSLTQDPATALYAASVSVAMGTVHVLTGKNLLITYPVMLVMFIL